MFRANYHTFCIIILFICIILSCKTVDNISMHPHNGYPMLKSVKKIKHHLKIKGVDFIRFNSGDVIADIGSGNGYLEAMLSIFNDSITFYIQDIDTSVCNKKNVKKTFDFYQKIRGTQIANKYFVINGTDTTTNLPENTFNKIFMLWTYQYFIYPDKIMKDINSKLKEDGLLYVINPNIEYHTVPERTKGHWNNSPIDIQITEIINCGFELILIKRSYESFDRPYIMVFKKNKKELFDHER